MWSMLLPVVQLLVVRRFEGLAYPVRRACRCLRSVPMWSWASRLWPSTRPLRRVGRQMPLDIVPRFASLPCSSRFPSPLRVARPYLHGCDVASFQPRYLAHYEHVREVLRERLPELGEGKGRLSRRPSERATRPAAGRACWCRRRRQTSVWPVTHVERSEARVDDGGGDVLDVLGAAATRQRARRSLTREAAAARRARSR